MEQSIKDILLKQTIQHQQQQLNSLQVCTNIYCLQLCGTFKAMLINTPVQRVISVLHVQGNSWQTNHP